MSPAQRHFLAAPTVAARAALASFLLSACTRQPPPTPEVSASVALPESASPLGSAPFSSVGVAPAAGGAEADAAPADPSHLPQTREVPHARGPAFDSRVAALLAAIASDDPDRAMPFFFPLGAYEQVKDVANPAADWRHRLVAAYARDIHTLHRRLAASTASASPDSAVHESDAAGRPFRAATLEVPEARARWVEPGEEYNKIGYYRVFGSRILCDIDGASYTFDVKSLISWRGEWYIVHLSAIQ